LRLPSCGPDDRRCRSWRGLIATEDQASGSTLRRCLMRWARTGLLAKVHALLVGMLRGHPDLILDACSVRVKRGGDLTGPNPTDRGKRGTKYHVAVDGDGVPMACAATAANVNDTVLFERLFLGAFAVMARIRTVFADKGYDAEANRELCRTFGAEPCLPQTRSAAWLGPGQVALASRAQQCLGTGEQTAGAALRPARVHHPIPAAGGVHLSGCRPPRSQIVTTAS
jgi:Transposase DDE domain